MKFSLIFTVILFLINIRIFAESSFKDQLYRKASLEISEHLKGVQIEDKIIAIAPFNNDRNFVFTSYLVEELSSHFTILDKTNLEILFNTALIFDDPIFKERPNLGQFENADYLLFGSLSIGKSNNLFKKHHNLNVDFNLDDLTRGTVIIKRNIQISMKNQISIIFFIVPMFFFLLSVFFLNYFLKGYYAAILFIIALLISVGYALWFFLI